MDADYLLIAVDQNQKFSIRFLSLSHGGPDSLKLKQAPKSFEKPYLEMLLGSVLLGSRLDDQESKLFTFKLNHEKLQINCEVSPQGSFRSAIFPKENLPTFRGDLSGEFRVSVLNQNNEVYTSQLQMHPAGVTETFRHYLTVSVQSFSVFSIHADIENTKNNFALWIEKLPGTSLEDWKKIAATYADNNLFLKSFATSDDPDSIMQKLFADPIRILAVTKPKLTCHCSLEAFRNALSILPKEDLLELFMEGKGVESQCDYCGKVWKVDDSEVQNLIKVNPQIH